MVSSTLTAEKKPVVRAARPSRADSSRQRTAPPVLVFGVIVSALLLFPFGWSILSSFGESPAGQSSVLPEQWGLGNYERLAGYGAGIWTYLGNTVLISVLTVVFSVVASVLAGYGFARFRFPGKTIVFFGILAVIMVPHSTLLIPLYTILATFGLTNSIVTLALIYATFQLPFGVYMMRNTFEAIPKEIEESAALDGCGPVRTLLRVLMPIAVPGVVTVALFAFLAAWNEFLAPLIFLTDDRQFTLPIALQSISVGSLGAVDYGALQAGITVSTLPCIVLFVLLQKYYVNGLVNGALKG
ncbi:carbohydrate ABC transporter permease [Microbacterium sp. 10M-3C3]|uniref:carbohydrate ABC transporter permease n=1 Tax=Microbacterium sp. 10M-3C3 TaxID=2483401 RepID=UPI000F63BFAB|nr:carbohydrate ABC transporter permease [Microbacterium sp. 10M-3C3]